MHADGQRFTLRCERLRVVAEPQLLQELRSTVGAANVRVVSAGPPRLRSESGNGNGNGRGRGAGADAAERWKSRQTHPAQV